MARAIWSGAVSFGLVSIGVKVYGAVSKKSVKFNQIDSGTMSRIKQKRFNSEGEEVAFDQIVKGFEVEKDQYVILTDTEMASVAPKASRTIEISGFVDGSQIDPLIYDSAYYLVPEELARKPYALLIKAMESSGKVAIAKVVMRSKEYLVAVRPRDGALVMSTMVYADEVVNSSSLPGSEELLNLDAPTDAELAMADQLIDSLSVDFDFDSYGDTYREKLMEIIEKKADGSLEAVTSAEEESDAAVLDLMAALEASLAESKDQDDETKSA